MAVLDLGMFYNPQAAPPELGLANLALERDTALTNTTLGQTLLDRNFRTRQIPSIVNARAAKGGFYSGQTTKQLGQAQEDFSQQVGQLRYDLQQNLLNIARNRFLGTVGMPLG